MIEIIHKQNRYLHEVYAISVINLGNVEGIFNRSRKSTVEVKRKQSGAEGREDMTAEETHGGQLMGACPTQKQQGSMTR